MRRLPVLPRRHPVSDIDIAVFYIASAYGEAADVRNELLGFDRLLELLQTCRQPIDDRTVYDVVCRFTDGTEQADDIAIMSVTRK